MAFAFAFDTGIGKGRGDKGRTVGTTKRHSQYGDGQLAMSTMSGTSHGHLPWRSRGQSAAEITV